MAARKRKWFLGQQGTTKKASDLQSTNVSSALPLEWVTNFTDYTGHIFIRATVKWVAGWEQKLGMKGANSSDVRLYVSLLDDCDSTEATGTYAALKGGSNKVLSMSNDPYWQGPDSDYISACFSCFVKCDGAGNTTKQTVATIELDSFSDSKYTNQLNVDSTGSPEPQSFDIEVPASADVYLPLYGCPPPNVFKNNDDSINNKCYPVWSTENTIKKIWVKVPKGSLIRPAEGLVIGANLSADNENGDVSKGIDTEEIYYFGPEQSAIPDPTKEVIDFTDNGQLQPPPSNNINFSPYWKKQASAQWALTITKEKGILKAGTWWDEKASSSSACQDEYSSDQKKGWFEKDSKAFAKGGFNLGITNAVYNGAVFKHANNGGQGTAKDIFYKESVRYAHKRTAMCAMPAGMKTELTQTTWGLMPETDAGGKKVSVYMPNTAAKTFFAHLRHSIEHRYKFDILNRAMIRRGFGDDNPDVRYHSTDPNGSVYVVDPDGKIIKDRILQYTQKEISMGIEQMMTTQSALAVGYKHGELFETTFNYSVSNSITTKKDSTGARATEQEDWQASMSTTIKGFSQWAAAAPSRVALTDPDEFDKWKDQYTINVDLGSGGNFKSEEVKNSAKLDKNGNVYWDPIDTVFEEKLDQDYGDSGLKLKGVKLGYQSVVWNSMNFNISNITAYSGHSSGKANLTDPEQFNYTLSGKTDGDIRWTINKSTAGVSLGIGLSIKLIDRANKNAKRLDGTVGRPSLWNDAQGVLRGIFNKLPFEESVLNIGLTVNDHEAGKWEFSHTAGVTSKLWGFKHGMDMKQGSQYVTRTWKKSFKDNFPEFLKAKDDNLDLTFSLRSDGFIFETSANEGEFNGNFGQMFTKHSAKVDWQLNKHLIEFGEITGRLKLTANLAMKFSQVKDSTSFARKMGWETGVQIVWENNILEWFGFPFNLNPGIKLMGAGSIRFGGYTHKPKPSACDNKNPIEDCLPSKGIEWQSNHVYKFAMGPITWDISFASTFRQHLQARHKSMFSFLGLGQCPILNKLGNVEPIWEYILRTAPFNALATLDYAAKQCAEARGKEIQKIYNNIMQCQRRIPAYWQRNIVSQIKKLNPKTGIPTMNGLNINGNQFMMGAPICGQLLHYKHGYTTKKKYEDPVDWEGRAILGSNNKKRTVGGDAKHFMARRSEGWGNAARQVGIKFATAKNLPDWEEDETMLVWKSPGSATFPGETPFKGMGTGPSPDNYPSWHRHLASQALILVDAAGGPGQYTDELETNAFPCLLTKMQVTNVVNVLMKKWDTLARNQRCKCIKQIFAQKTDGSGKPGTRYRDNYDWKAYGDELGGGTGVEMGMVSRGLNVIDQTVLNYALDYNMDAFDDNINLDVKIGTPPTYKFDDLPALCKEGARYTLWDGKIQIAPKREKLTQQGCFGLVIRPKLYEIMQNVGIDDQHPDHSKITTAIDKTYAPKSWAQTWLNGGLCGTIFKTFKAVVSAVAWIDQSLTRGILGSLFGGIFKFFGSSGGKTAERVLSTVYDPQKPCDVPGTTITGGGSAPSTPSHCYHYFRAYNYWDYVYRPLQSWYTQGIAQQSQLFPFLATNYQIMITTHRAGQMWKYQFIDGPERAVCVDTPRLGDPTWATFARDLAEHTDSINIQKHILKAILTYYGMNTGRADGTLKWQPKFPYSITHPSRICGPAGENEMHHDFTNSLSNDRELGLFGNSKELDIANGMAGTYRTPSSRNFARELADFFQEAVPGGAKHVQCDCDYGYNASEDNDYAKIQKIGGTEGELAAQSVQRHMADAGICNAVTGQTGCVGGGAPLTYKDWSGSGPEQTYQKEGLAKSYQLVWSNTDSLGRDHNEIISVWLPYLLMDPMLYKLNSNSITAQLFTDQNYALKDMYDAFAVCVDKLNYLGGTARNLTVSTQKNREASEAIKDFQDALLNHNKLIIDALQSKVYHIFLDYLMTFKAHYRAILMADLCQYDVPIRALAHLDVGNAQGWNSSALGISDTGSKRYAQIVFETLFGSVGGYPTPTLKSIITGTGNIPMNPKWDFEYLPDLTAMTSSWNPLIRPFMKSIFRAIKLDKYASLYADFFGKAGVTNGTYSLEDAISWADPAQTGLGPLQHIKLNSRRQPIDPTQHVSGFHFPYLKGNKRYADYETYYSNEHATGGRQWPMEEFKYVSLPILTKNYKVGGSRTMYTRASHWKYRNAMYLLTTSAWAPSQPKCLHQKLYYNALKGKMHHRLFLDGLSEFSINKPPGAHGSDQNWAIGQTSFANIQGRSYRATVAQPNRVGRNPGSGGVGAFSNTSAIFE